LEKKKGNLSERCPAGKGVEIRKKKREGGRKRGGGGEKWHKTCLTLRRELGC